MTLVVELKGVIPAKFTAGAADPRDDDALVGVASGARVLWPDARPRPDEDLELRLT